MDNDERERRDTPDPGDAPQPGRDAEMTEGDASPTPEPPADPAPSEIESWPSTDVPPPSSVPDEAPAWPSEAPVADAAAVEAWPTEPPAAGSGDADTWPTTPPEMGGEPILEPQPEPTQPPSEVEAYPAAAAASQAASAEGLDPVPAVEPEPVAEPAQEPIIEQAAPAAAAAVVAAPDGEGTRCPRCGTDNQAGLSFCRNCGQRLVAAGVASTVDRPATPEGTMACPRCGTHNRAGVAFCQNCGANLRGAASGYVPPAVAGAAASSAATATSGGAVLGPVVLIIGVIGLITAYLLPFTYGTTSLYDRAFGSNGYGVSFWTAMPDGGLIDQAYFALAAATPILAAVVVLLAIAGFVRARPGPVAVAGLAVALAWSVALAVLFIVVELFGNWDGDIVGLLRVLSPAGIILFLSSLIVIIGTLTRFGRS